MNSQAGGSYGLIGGNALSLCSGNRVRNYTNDIAICTDAGGNFSNISP